MSNTLALMIQRSLDIAYTNEPNDILAIKAHYIKALIDELFEKNTEDMEKACNDLSKKYEKISWRLNIK